MNNAINEIKNTLEGTNSRIMEAEDRISEGEDRMVEINEAEKTKELKEMRTTSGTSGTMLNAPRHILIKLTKIRHKEQILKAAREKQQITHKGIPIRITPDLSIETLQARRE